jgi:hypothetical protein
MFRRLNAPSDDRANPTQCYERIRASGELGDCHGQSRASGKPADCHVGWTKARELVKVARKDGTEFASCTWVHKAKELPREEFKREVERHLTGKETEAWEIIYFKLYKSRLPVVERALETAALMLGSDKARGYCLEMICADFLAGADLETGAAEKSIGCSISSGDSCTASERLASKESGR